MLEVSTGLNQFVCCDVTITGLLCCQGDRDEFGGYQRYRVTGVTSCQHCTWSVTYFTGESDAYNLSDSVNFISKAIGKILEFIVSVEKTEKVSCSSLPDAFP